MTSLFSEHTSVTPPYSGDDTPDDGKPAQQFESHFDWRDPRHSLHQAYLRQQTPTAMLPKEARMERDLRERGMREGRRHKSAVAERRTSLDYEGESHRLRH